MIENIININISKRPREAIHNNSNTNRQIANSNTITKKFELTPLKLFVFSQRSENHIIIPDIGFCMQTQCKLHCLQLELSSAALTT